MLKIKTHSLKSQVTAFIVIGIVIVGIVWIAMYLSDYFGTKKLEVPLTVKQQLNLESDTIKGNIDSCVQTLTDKGVQFMSDQGFYLNIPDNYEYDNGLAYWLTDTMNVMPYSFEKFENDLAFYVNSNLPDCFDLNKFIKNGWDITSFNTSTSAKIFEDDIGVEVNYTIKITKQDFEREFVNSIYNPKIRFKAMFNKSVDFINSQLLRPDFLFDDPFNGYNSSYNMSYQKLDHETLLFSIQDPNSKILDGRKFTLRFVAGFGINNVSRTYDVSNSSETRFLFSPDRLAVITLEPGIKSSSNYITMGQYSVPEVIRKDTPIEKINAEITQTRDITFKTNYPIYKFSPSGTNFTGEEVLDSGTLRIYQNKDQIPFSDDFTVLYSGINGWLPYPNEIEVGDGFIDTAIFGFSEYTIADCDTMSNQDYPGPKAEEKRSFFATFGIIIMLIVMIVMIVILWPAAPALGTAGGTITAPVTITGPVGTTIYTTSGPVLIGSSGSAIITPAVATGTTTILSSTAPLTLTSGSMVVGSTSTATIAGTIAAPGAAASGTTTLTAGALQSSLGSIVGAILPNWATSALTAYANSIFLRVGMAAMSAYSAYGLWNMVADTEKTMVFTAVCKGSMLITPDEENGDCDCYVTDTLNPDPQPTNGVYDVERANTYTVTAAVTDFDFLQQEASCQCNVNGMVVSSSTDTYVDCNKDSDCKSGEYCNNQKCDLIPSNITLVCCVTTNGYCLDNYLIDGSLNQSCDGDSYNKTCDQIQECPPTSAKSMAGGGISSQTSNIGDSDFTSSGIEGDGFLISYTLESKNSTKVTAHIKADSVEIDTLDLYDDGNHNDESANDGTYANTWYSNNALNNNQDSSIITYDIEIKYGDVYTETVEVEDEILLINNNLDCEPFGLFSPDNLLDIVFVANNYNDINKFSTDADLVAARIIMTNPFTEYYTDKGINFYKVKNMKEISSLNQVGPYVNRECRYRDTHKRLTIVLNENAGDCTSQGNVIEVEPVFGFKSEIQNAKINSILVSFCSFVNELAFASPPSTQILTQSKTIVPSNVDIEFQITDNKYPVNYDLLWNYVTLISGSVSSNAPKTHTLNLPEGDWIIQIKATDSDGNIDYSNEITLTAQSEAIAVDFSGIYPLTIATGDSIALSLNNYVTYPNEKQITGWSYTPSSSDCISFNPATIGASGQVTLTHIKGSECMETITFEVKVSGNEQASDTLEIRAG